MKPKLTVKQKAEITKMYGKIPSKEEIFAKLKASQERLVVTLAAAWETAPDDPKIRKELLKAMEKAMRLRNSVYKEVLKEEPPELRKSYERIRKILDSN